MRKHQQRVLKSQYDELGVTFADKLSAAYARIVTIEALLREGIDACTDSRNYFNSGRSVFVAKARSLLADSPSSGEKEHG